MKSFLRAFLVFILVSGLALAGIANFGVIQASTDVTGIISSDTTWTKANSPYSLTGPMLVSEGVTLTIEPGVTVNFNEYYIKVNGTLVARGSNADPINCNGGSNISPNYAITFTSSSSDWNEQTATGCIIENSILSSIYISGASPKIDKNSISAFYAIDIYGGSSVISNNNISGQISLHAGSPEIENNSIIGGIFVAVASTPVISNNTITGGISTYGSSAGIGIDGNATISGNIIYGCQTGIHAVFGISTIENNLIINNDDGIDIGYPQGVVYTGSGFKATIRHNTIANNLVGINIMYYPPNLPSSTFIDTSVQPIIIDNNIQNNSNYNIYLGSQLGVTVTNNWWETTDTQSINQTIYDFKNDFNLGIVDFVPFLTEPNPEAPKVSEPKPEPQQPDQQTTILIAASVTAVVVCLGLVIYLIKRK